MLISMSDIKNAGVVAAGNDAKHFPVDEILLDKQDILMRMHISARTLQIWRSEGILPFARIRKKIYYRESDLRALLSQHFLINKKPNDDNKSKTKSGKT
jgi:hypothetical protein